MAIRTSLPRLSGYKVIIAESHCGHCEWSMVLAPGERTTIAGYPHITATPRDMNQAERIVRAWSWMHWTRHRDTEPRTRGVNRAIGVNQ